MIGQRIFKEVRGSCIYSGLRDRMDGVRQGADGRRAVRERVHGAGAEDVNGRGDYLEAVDD